MLKVKICGMKDPENARAVARAYPDFMGFIFYEGSKRFVASMDDQLLDATADCRRVAVFVNADLDDVGRALGSKAFEAVQLHGEESLDYCVRLRKAAPEVRIIKAFGVGESLPAKAIKDYSEVCDFILLDKASAERGGTGQKFSWARLGDYPVGAKPLFLAGGLGREDLAALHKLYMTGVPLYALDFNSRVEIEPGLKDALLVREIVEEVSAWD